MCWYVSVGNESPQLLSLRGAKAFVRPRAYSYACLVHDHAPPMPRAKWDIAFEKWKLGKLPL